MLTKNRELVFTFFDVGGGDATWIRFLGDDENWHNILVDGGFGQAYKNAFGPLINQIISGGECVDLWIVTHIDLDHIGALLGFIQDKKIKGKSAAVREFWFNHTNFSVLDSNGKLAVGHGIKVRDYLSEMNQLRPEIITIDSNTKNFWGLEVTILSPTAEKQHIVDKNWIAEEKKGKVGRSATKSDHEHKIETFTNSVFTEDSDATNGSSIAFLLQYKKTRGLLLADSHPSDITAVLKNLKYNQSNPLQVDFIQVAHHGSKANTSPELLEITDTSVYVITGNGITNRHPDKETLARILTNKTRGIKTLTFVFVSNTKEVKSIFNVDDTPYEKFNFSSVYLESGAQYITLDFLPINTNNGE